MEKDHFDQTPAGREVVWLDTVDSTNDECKRRAAHQSYPHGLAVIAGRQTRGKGRRGRSFQSLEGQGLYLSALWTPPGDPEAVSQLTAWVAVAVAAAVEQTTGLKVDVKWPNDLQIGGKKLCGILTELSLEPRTQAVQYVVVGIGVNLTQTAADFGPELAPIAVSLAQAGAEVSREELAAAILDELDALAVDFPSQREKYLTKYRQECVTLGQEVTIFRPTSTQDAVAMDVDESFALLVRYPDGTVERVTSGEVSVRLRK